VLILAERGNVVEEGKLRAGVGCLGKCEVTRRCTKNTQNLGG
jgi:hypothetical protein